MTEFTANSHPPKMRMTQQQFDEHQARIASGKAKRFRPDECGGTGKTKEQHVNTSMGSLQSGEPEQRPPTLEPLPKANKNGKRRPAYRVAFIAVRARELDNDNLIGGYKPFRDAVADYLGLPDDKNSIRFSYAQVVSGGEQGTIVMIEKLEQTKGTK